MKKKEKPVWAKNIMSRRKALGYKSALAFSEAAGIPYGTFRDIENGISEGYLESREAIAKALRCTLADLYKDESQAHLWDLTADLGFDVAVDVLSRLRNLPEIPRRIALSLIFEDVTIAPDIEVDLRDLFEKQKAR